MKFWRYTRQENFHAAPITAQPEDDLFQPLRRSRSPLSLNSIKHYILDRSVSAIQAAERPSLWAQLRGLGLEFFTLGAIAGIVSFASTPSIPISGAATNEKNTIAAIPAIRVAPDLQVGYNFGAGSEAPVLHAVQHSFRSTDEVVAQIHPASTTAQLIQPAKHSAISQPFGYPFAASMEESTTPHYFASLQGGAAFDRMRMLTEGISIGATRDWQMIALQYSAITGRRDAHDLLSHHAPSDVLLQSEDRREVSLLLGGIARYGNMNGSIALGPSYLFMTNTFYNQSSQLTTAPVFAKGLGLAVQASIGYEFNNFVSAGITGFAYLHSMTSGSAATNTAGISLSIVVEP
jgi:hypothetical protein